MEAINSTALGSFAIDYGTSMGLGANDMLLLLSINNNAYYFVTSANDVIPQNRAEEIVSNSFLNTYKTGDYDKAVCDLFAALDSSYSPNTTGTTTTSIPPTPVPTTVVTSITITAYDSPLAFNPFTQQQGIPIQLGVLIYPKEALTEHAITWRSSDDTICTVDQTGLVTPISSGQCDIIVECGGLTDRCTIHVP